jgi:membrane protease YdiL (CAAX protease family)
MMQTSLGLWASAGPRSSLTLDWLDGPSGALLKALLPLVAYAAAAPLLWIFFRSTWRELDAAATDDRFTLRLSGKQDHRPWAMFAIAALVLTAQDYYGGSIFFARFINPWLREIEVDQLFEPGGLGQYVDIDFYGEMYSYAWWAFTRVAGYSIIPLVAWKLLYPKDSLLDMGFRVKGLMRHAWIYLTCLAVVVPLVFAVSRSPEFANYYPFYKLCSRSWMDLLVWETMYIAQFFALEVFFRGFMLGPLRQSFGSGAIFAMCVPYVMIHYGKPYLEASVAFLAGVALGSLAMKTRSIYWGFVLHITVALLMDGLALLSSDGLPTTFWPR